MRTEAPQKQNWDQYWSGRQGQNNASALVGIETHPEIQAFWREALAGFDQARPAADIACGAGTVAKLLVELGGRDVHGVDISPSAIDILTRTEPKITGHVSALDSLPFTDGQLAMVVSQYGFEYGELEPVVAEIARALGEGGQFIALAHKVGGAIHDEVSTQLQSVQKIHDSGFISASKAMFTAAMSKESGLSPQQVGALIRPAQQILMPMARGGDGLAQHLYINTQRMYKERNEYHLRDILAWLDGMNTEIETFLGRMSEMCAAALDTSDIDAIRAQFARLGLSSQPAQTLVDTSGGELGWILRIQRD